MTLTGPGLSTSPPCLPGKRGQKGQGQGNAGDDSHLDFILFPQLRTQPEVAVRVRSPATRNRPIADPTAIRNPRCTFVRWA